MSRSRLKTPVTGITTAKSEKEDKRRANRRNRRTNRVLLRTKGQEAVKLEKETSNIWSFEKDGKSRFDPLKHPKLLRK